ncbi:MAG: hypothetical protein ACR2HY_10910 [Acidimicrobiales bacterium]
MTSSKWWFRSGRRAALFVVAAATAVASMVGMLAPTAASAATRTYSLSVVARDFQFLGVPSRLPAGTANVRFRNISRSEFHEFIAVNLGPACAGFTRDQAIAEITKAGQAEDPIAAAQEDCPGLTFAGAAFAPPGGSDRETYDFQPGRVLYFCSIPDENGTPHFDLGMIGFINVFSVPGR